jgi:hypothetical protein
MKGVFVLPQDRSGPADLTKGSAKELAERAHGPDVTASGLFSVADIPPGGVYRLSAAGHPHSWSDIVGSRR